MEYILGSHLLFACDELYESDHEEELGKASNDFDDDMVILNEKKIFYDNTVKKDDNNQLGNEKVY